MERITPGTRTGLGRGYFITAPQLSGNAELLEPGQPGVRAREGITDLFDAALARNDMRSIATVELTEARREPSGGESVRGPSGDDSMIFETPNLGPTVGQVVVSVDEAGAVTWNFPLDQGLSVEAPDRAAGKPKRFLIRTYTPPPPPSEQARDRSLFGTIGKKLLKVVVFPLTDTLIGKGAAYIANHWESKRHPYGVRDFTTANYQKPAGKEIGSPEVTSLAQGQALLFVHGTFSTAHGAFFDMPRDLLQSLHERYAGRVFAFNHYSLSADPTANVKWLADRLSGISPDKSLNVDIVCHSRGGLVARTLATGHGNFSQDRVKVRRIVFVATPNHGTPLAHPDRVTDMIDRLTSGLNLALPTGGVEDFIDGLLAAVKVIAHGAMKGLAGIQSMNPEGKWLETLNKQPVSSPEWFAISADYEPKDPGLMGLIRKPGAAIANRIVDRVFENSKNDLVVPEKGVYDVPGAPGFPITGERCHQVQPDQAAWHTKLFGRKDVAEKISQWLA